MNNQVLLGRGQQILAIPRDTWKQHLAQVPQHSHERLGFMTAQHRQIRYFVVSELARLGKPLTPEHISAAFNIPLEQVIPILVDLEGKLFFLVRDNTGAVAWAYPVTVEPTLHRLQFSTGEKLYGA
jgi:hypothetical protein